MVTQNHAVSYSDQNSNFGDRSLILKYLIDSQNAGYSIHCSYFLNEKVVIELAVVEKGDHHKKVIMSSYLNIYAPVFLLFPPIFSVEKSLFLFVWMSFVLGDLASSQDWIRLNVPDEYYCPRNWVFRLGASLTGYLLKKDVLYHGEMSQMCWYSHIHHCCPSGRRWTRCSAS